MLLMELGWNGMDSVIFFERGGLPITPWRIREQAGSATSFGRPYAVSHGDFGLRLKFARRDSLLACSVAKERLAAASRAGGQVIGGACLVAAVRDHPGQWGSRQHRISNEPEQPGSSRDALSTMAALNALENGWKTVPLGIRTKFHFNNVKGG